jgi:hypothetical protein
MRALLDFRDPKELELEFCRLFAFSCVQKILNVLKNYDNYFGFDLKKLKRELN